VESCFKKTRRNATFQDTGSAALRVAEKSPTPSGSATRKESESAGGNPKILFVF
jgi:hypothetical protein